jgi:glycosyltransferase involved in cell wall biosynthesis
VKVAPLRVLAIMEATTVTGPAKNLLEFARRAKTGDPPVQLSILTFRRAGGGEPATPFITAARAEGLEVAEVEERFRFDPGVVRALRREIDRMAPDVVQSHQVKSHFLVAVAGLGSERPWVAFHHGYTTTDLKMRAYNQIDRFSLPRARQVVTVSQPFARQLESVGVRPARIRVLHNSVRVDRPDGVRADPALCAAAARLRAQHGIADDAKVVAAVGRLSHEKAFPDLVAAVARLPLAPPAWLVIVGDGPERARVTAAAASHGIADRVLITGHQADVATYYALADVVAISSLSEGSPNVLLEAMAAGVPVVATAVGGIPEIVTHEESALLCAASDPRALAAAIERVLGDAALGERLVAGARRRVKADHTPEGRASALGAIYRGLVASGQTA